MNILNIYYCPQCRNVGVAYGGPAVECCGSRLETVPVETASMLPTITETDGEYMLEYACPMTKDDFIAAVIVERHDRVELIRLFPEQAAEVRVPQIKGAKIHTVFCRQGKVWSEILK